MTTVHTGIKTSHAKGGTYLREKEFGLQKHGRLARPKV